MKIFLLLLLIWVVSHGCIGVNAGEAVENDAGESEAGVFQVVNAVALPGRLDFEVDGHSLHGDGFAFSRGSGKVGLLVGRREFRFTHPGVEGVATHELEVGGDTDVTLVVLAAWADAPDDGPVGMVVEAIDADDIGGRPGIWFVLAAEADEALTFELEYLPSGRKQALTLEAGEREKVLHDRQGGMWVSFDGQKIGELIVSPSQATMVFIVPTGKLGPPRDGHAQRPPYLCIPVDFGGFPGR